MLHILLPQGAPKFQAVKDRYPKINCFSTLCFKNVHYSNCVWPVTSQPLTIQCFVVCTISEIFDYLQLDAG